MSARKLNDDADRADFILSTKFNTSLKVEVMDRRATPSAHCVGYNDDSIGICLEGELRHRDQCSHRPPAVGAGGAAAVLKAKIPGGPDCA